MSFSNDAWSLNIELTTIIVARIGHWWIVWTIFEYAFWVLVRLKLDLATLLDIWVDCSVRIAFSKLVINEFMINMSSALWSRTTRFENGFFLAIVRNTEL